MGVGRKRRAGGNVSRDTNDRHHAGAFKTSLFRERDPASPDPNADPNAPQPAPVAAARPASAPGRAPRAPGFRRARGRRGAGRSRRLDALLPRQPQHAGPRRPSPASWAGPRPSCRPRAPPLDSLVGGGLGGGGGRRLTGRPLSGFPSPPPSIRRLRRPGSAPGSRSGRKAPGPEPAPTAGPTLGLPSFSLP